MSPVDIFTLPPVSLLISETFIAQRELDGKGLPEFIVKELKGFLRCGVLQYGFLRTKCKSCDFERAVPCSCKGRGFCPSYCGKRMAEKAYHLIDNVLPDAPYRQWVLSLPIPLRFWIAANARIDCFYSKIRQRVQFKYSFSFEGLCPRLGTNAKK